MVGTSKFTAFLIEKGVVKFLTLIAPGGEGGSGKSLASRKGGGGGLQGSHIVLRDI